MRLIEPQLRLADKGAVVYAVQGDRADGDEVSRERITKGVGLNSVIHTVELGLINETSTGTDYY